MQKGPSQISSGNIAPTVVGPQKDMRDVFVLAGLVLFLSGLIAAAWYYGQTSEQVKITAATEKVDNTDVSEILRKAGGMNEAEAALAPSTPATAPVVTPADIIHADVYFEVGRTGLTDESKALLSAHTALLKQHEDYGVLIQGYTDPQGPASSNKKLGLKRAETIKAELVKAGIAEHRIATVSLGEEGVVCVDSSDICRQTNRRAHLELRKIGREHMVVPTIPSTPAVDPAGPGNDSTVTSDQAGSLDESSLPLSSTPAAPAPEPIPGS